MKQSGHLNPSEEIGTGCLVTSKYGRTPPNKHGGVGRQQQQQQQQMVISAIIGSSWSIHFFRCHVDIGSRSQVLLGEESITSRTSSQLAGFTSRR